MGEVKIKSGNLFDVTTVTYVYLDVQGGEHSSEVSRTSDYIPVTANTLYTLGMTGGSSSLNLTAYCFYDSSKEFLSSGTYRPSTIGNIVSITTPNNCAYFRFTYNQQRILVEFVSGVYNTFPPYFLNLPSHQKTSTGWKDIPTHTMTATGWQGELTSQSPLEFRATGQSLLDWRIEGKTSGNLYAIELGDDRWGTLGNSQIISRTDGVLQIEMASETNSGVYALSTSAISQLSDIRNTVSYSFDIRADTDISVLVGYEVQGARATLRVSDEWVTVKFENILFTQKYSFTIANRSSGGTIYVRNFMFNLGSTALPYEPYGGVGDWDETAQKYRIPVTVNGVTTNLFTNHQLMDGDSIDFTTDQTQIPLATGNNILTVDTAVKPNKVFVKFEG